MLLRCLGIIFITFAVSIKPAWAEAQPPFLGRVKSDRVYLRAGQNVNFEAVAVVNKGDTLVVLSKNYGWLKVKVPTQAKAYLKAEYAVSSTSEIGVITADKVNVRCAPNTDATIIGKLVRGDRFYIHAKEGDWLRIKPTDQLSAWVKGEFVEPVKGAAVPARLYPDPPLDNKVVLPQAAVSQPSLIKKLDNGLVEFTGILEKTKSGYLLMRDGMMLCVVSGLGQVLDSFVGSAVIIQGKYDQTVDASPPIIILTKIKLVH